MKEEKIKPLPVVKEFTNYFVRRAKRALKIKNAEFVSITMDVFMRSGHIWVWFHGSGDIIAKAEFEFNGHLSEKKDYRLPETETITQGKLEDA